VELRYEKVYVYGLDTFCHGFGPIDLVYGV